jgi:Tfp pilus assembly protein FimT
VNRLASVGEVEEVELEEPSRVVLVQVKEQATRISKEIGNSRQRAVILRLCAVSGKRSWGKFRGGVEAVWTEQWTLQTSSEGSSLRELLLDVCKATCKEKKCSEWAIELVKK